MVKLSNSVVGILNFVTFLLSVPILGAGIWLCTKASTDCEKFLQKPLIVLGVFLLLVSLAGLIGACCRVSWLLWVYLLVMFLLIVLLFCFTIFAFVVSNKGKGVVGQVVSGRGYKEYRLGDYSNWLQKSTIDNWGKYRSCLIDGKVCKTLSQDRDANNGFDKFIKKNLNPIQSGCCTPPAECAFTYQNATVWNKPANAINSTNPDCTSWNNQDLCFNCQSCKAGVIANTKSNWRKVATFNIIFLVFLIIVYSIGCCAFRNNKHYNSFPRWKGGHA